MIISSANAIKGDANAQASYYGERIRAELATPNPDVLVLDRTFATQSIDPVCLEPEGGIAWYDAKQVPTLLTEPQRAAVLELDAALAALSTPQHEELWFDNDWVRHPVWDDVRRLAASMFGLFGWSPTGNPWDDVSLSEPAG